MPLPRRFLPSLTALRALEALERLGSLSAVADELALSQSAVSRQLQGLETQLGVPLFLREGRRLVLRSETRAYASEMRAALNRITQASLKLTLNPEGGSLDLAILPTFGMRWLVPRLPGFAAAHPEVSLNLSTRVKPFNFALEPFDAAIQFGDANWPGTRALRLKREAMVAVAAPELLVRARITKAQDVLALPLLHIETRPDAWRDWFAAHGVADAVVTGTIYDQFSTITQAALHGLGVALLPDYLAEQDLATGRLITAWGGRTEMPGAYHLVWPEEKSQDRALQVFREWLAPMAEDEDPLPR